MMKGWRSPSSIFTIIVVSVVGMVEGQGIDVSIDVNDVSIEVSKIQFQGALPSNMTAISYDDSNVSSAQAQCPAGYYCPANSTVSQPCPAGTYQGSVGKIALSDCKACDAGSYCPSAATVAEISCPAGYQCPSASMVNASVCGVGTFQGTTGQISCIPCYAGYKCNATGMTAMIQCGIGKYQPQTGQSVCLTCPLGQICTNAATQNPTNCSLGYFADPLLGGDEAGDCRVCPAGQYCPLLTTAPVNCSAGTYRSAVGGYMAANCSACPLGQYCEEKTVDPADCPSGTYMSSLGAQKVSDCVVCPPGQYCIPSSASPANCSAGRYRATSGGKSNSDCLDCPAGKYCTEKTSIPQNCSAGTYNSGPLGASIAACLVCPAGKYCEVGTISPISCPSGTYLLSPGGGSVLENCLICATGTFDSTAAGARTSVCETCLVDKYCPNPLVQLPCPANTQATSGSSSQLSCRCVQGYVCSYTKKIKASFTLNTTIEAWNANLDGVRDKFKQAIADAAHVQLSQVIISNVKIHSTGRRLLSFNGIVVSADVEGAHKFFDLHLHVKDKWLLQSHTWQEAHAVHTRFVHKVKI